MYFDITNFKRDLLEPAYRRLGDPAAYSLEDYFSIFEYFFKAYEKYRFSVHPWPSKEQVFEMLRAIPYAPDIGSQDPGECLALFPAEYPELIERYFSTSFEPGCNYRISHFLSGQIRGLRLYEKEHEEGREILKHEQPKD